MSRRTEADPSRERTMGAAVRDLVAGAALLAVGLAGGGSTLYGRGDGIDHVFDGLGLFWIAWGAFRLLRALRPGEGSAGTP